MANKMAARGKGLGTLEKRGKHYRGKIRIGGKI